MVRIGPLEEPHIPRITNIYNHYINNTTAIFFNESLTDADLTEMTACESPFAHFAVYEGGSVIGHAALKPHSPRSAYDNTADVAIILDENHCGSGAGTAVLALLEMEARERGFHTLLALICGENAASLAFFAKRGFTQNGQLKEVGYKFGRYLDVAYMQKIID